MLQPTIRALVVEDNPGDAELATLRLSDSRRVHFEVARATCLREATSWLERHDCDVTILDLNLPDSRGLDTLRAVRAAEPLVAVVVVSGAVDETLREAANALAEAEVICKDQLDSGLFASTILYVVERNRARDRQQQLEKILAVHPDAVVVVDHRGALEYVNTQALAFFERTRDELAQEPLLFAARDGAAVELRVTRPGGDKVGEMRVVEFDWCGEPSFLASIRDVTLQRNLEMQLLMSDRLVSLGTLAAGVAHEVNNPLAALLANAGIALQQATTLSHTTDKAADLVECLRDVREAADRIRQIVRDLKLFSRAEEDSRDLCSIAPLLDSVIRMAWPEIQHSARVVKEYGNVPPVHASESRLSQVFLNLLVNAGQAIPPGRAEHNEVRVTTRVLADGRVAIDVRDTGPGIPDDVKRRLFTPFFTTKPVGSGTGLGLAICQRIVRSLGGDITLESQVGHGTCFTVVLPAAPLEFGISRGSMSSELPAARRKSRLLVIDDDAMILKSVARVLKADHEVICLSSAAVALQQLEAGARFDLVLCDIMMPDMTGMEFHDALQAVAPELLSSVVYMTGGIFVPNVREFLDRVPNQRVEKPFDPQGLRVLLSGMVR